MRGGAERALAALARRLEAGGHAVLAFAARGPRPGEGAPGRFVPVPLRGLRRATREARLAADLVAAARAARCDVTIGVRHLAEVDLYWPHGGLHRATLALLGKRPRGRHRVFLELEDAALRGGARRILCVSELVRAEIERCVPEAAARCVLVPNGVDLERFHPARRDAARRELEARGLARSGEPLVLFLGRNPELKGLPLLLEALGFLRGTPWRLLVAGVRDVGRWRRRARRAGLAGGRVAVLSEIDAALACAGADVLALPTRRDPCPLVVLEALASGTPVVVSERAGSADAVASPRAGAVLPAEATAREWARSLSPFLALPRPASATEAARAAVASRGEDPWLAALEAQVLAAAAGSELPSPG